MLRSTEARRWWRSLLDNFNSPFHPTTWGAFGESNTREFINKPPPTTSQFFFPDVETIYKCLYGTLSNHHHLCTTFFTVTHNCIPSVRRSLPHHTWDYYCHEYVLWTSQSTNINWLGDVHATSKWIPRKNPEGCYPCVSPEAKDNLYPLENSHAFASFGTLYLPRCDGTTRSNYHTPHDECSTLLFKDDRLTTI